MKNRFQMILVLPVLMLVMQTVAASDNQRLTTVHHSMVIENYNAIEAEALRISLNDDLSGFIEGKVCDACEKIQVTITPATKAFANRVEVPLKRAKSRLGRDATVIYEVKTKNVTKISW
jgi:hypothetical protein